ncbi:hypothetical protein MPC4_50087 [Methylocella tundrae]|uniref:Uncharacterized protein n=1 Tax=Methylocella tundrae TaxID=227605 RepID=A0A8B6MC01_METTU|nr:hypothetical protein MPC1_550006 [Methylocella tundrae]VTZ51779.1 hypothetical protein MPC4_50087 [Methylocella tundrae]
MRHAQSRRYHKTCPAQRTTRRANSLEGRFRQISNGMIRLQDVGAGFSPYVALNGAGPPRPI